MGLKEDQVKLYKQLKDFIKFDFSIAHSVGQKGVNHLWRNYLSGQKIRYRSKIDTRRRRTLSYSVSRRGGTITFKSYPLNLWERGFTKLRGRDRKRGRAHYLRGSGQNTLIQGKTVPGRHILELFGNEIKSNYVAKWAEKGLTDKIKKTFS